MQCVLQGVGGRSWRPGVAVAWDERMRAVRTVAIGRIGYECMESCKEGFRGRGAPEGGGRQHGVLAEPQQLVLGRQRRRLEVARLAGSHALEEDSVEHKPTPGAARQRREGDDVKGPVQDAVQRSRREAVLHLGGTADEGEQHGAIEARPLRTQSPGTAPLHAVEHARARATKIARQREAGPKGAFSKWINLTFPCVSGFPSSGGPALPAAGAIPRPQR